MARGGFGPPSKAEINPTAASLPFHLQETYNLLAREEEHEMLPLSSDERVQTIVFSPLARGRLARPWGEPSADRSRMAAAQPVVAARIVGALKTKHIDDAVAALSVTWTDEEAARLEAPYSPRSDTQGVSEPAMPARSGEEVTGFKAGAA